LLRRLFVKTPFFGRRPFSSLAGLKSCQAGNGIPGSGCKKIFRLQKNQAAPAAYFPETCIKGDFPAVRGEEKSDLLKYYQQSGNLAPLLLLSWQGSRPNSETRKEVNHRQAKTSGATPEIVAGKSCV